MTAPALDPRGGEGHNHVTRDIKPVGKCPACDEYWGTNWGNPRPPAAGRGDTDDSGECQRSDWCGPGSHCLCVPAARPADTDDSRERIAREVARAFGNDWSWCTEAMRELYRADADRALSGAPPAARRATPDQTPSTRPLTADAPAPDPTTGTQTSAERHADSSQQNR